MEQTSITIAVTGTDPKAVKLLVQRFCFSHCFFSCPFTKKYTYMEQCYHFLCLSPPFLPSPLPDVVLVACHLSPSELFSSLKQGLALLSQVTSLPCIREEGIPAVLIFTAPKASFFQSCPVDFELLEDVLQIPVVPCPFVSSGTDDGKAAIAYVQNQHISYDCLDFSPEKLAGEALFLNMRPQTHSRSIRIFLSPASAVLLIFLLLFLLLWFTLTGAYYFSKLPLHLFSWPGKGFSLRTVFFSSFFWMIQVMLPLALLFLPLFFLLDETGILPRAAFLADRIFAPLGGCGEQCCTMAAGLSCHAAGIQECKKIPAPRERLTAILTVPLLPCWGRFPVFAVLTTLFVSAGGNSPLPGFGPHPSPFWAALCLAAVILMGTAASLCLSGCLSHTVLAPLPSAFFLELPLAGLASRENPPPSCSGGCPAKQKNAVLAKAWNRTCFILGRTAVWTAGISLLVWLLAILPGPEGSCLGGLIQLLEPLGRALGLDGVILSAFLLTTPANEILLPIAALLYLFQSGLPPAVPANQLYPLFLANGWTWHTVLSVMTFTLFHWPCLTALQAVYQVTQSRRWTAFAALIPTLSGIGICALIHWL